MSDQPDKIPQFLAVRPTPEELRWMRRGLNQPGGKIPVFDENDIPVDPKVVRRCLEQQWVEPWVGNQKDPNNFYMACRLSPLGRRLCAGEPQVVKPQSVGTQLTEHQTVGPQTVGPQTVGPQMETPESEEPDNGLDREAKNKMLLETLEVVSKRSKSEFGMHPVMGKVISWGSIAVLLIAVPLVVWQGYRLVENQNAQTEAEMAQSEPVTAPPPAAEESPQAAEEAAAEPESATAPEPPATEEPQTAEAQPVPEEAAAETPENGQAEEASAMEQAALEPAASEPAASEPEMAAAPAPIASEASASEESVASAAEPTAQEAESAAPAVAEAPAMPAESTSEPETAVQETAEATPTEMAPVTQTEPAEVQAPEEPSSLQPTAPQPESQTAGSTEPAPQQPAEEPQARPLFPWAPQVEVAPESNGAQTAQSQGSEVERVTLPPPETTATAATAPAPEATAAEAPTQAETEPAAAASSVGSTRLPPIKPEPPEAAVEETAATETAPQQASAPAAAPAPQPTPQPAAESVADSGGFGVQLAASPERSDAEWLMAKVTREQETLLSDHSLRIIRAEIEGKGTFFRVRTEAFGDQAEATRLCNALKEAGQDCFVYARGR